MFRAAGVGIGSFHTSVSHGLTVFFSPARGLPTLRHMACAPISGASLGQLAPVLIGSEGGLVVILVFLCECVRHQEACN